MIGKTISKYTILEKLGEGGMGVVYKARDLKLDRFVAIKFLPHYFSSDEGRKKRFIQEAKTASALDHPNIGVIYEFDEISGNGENDQMFIAMAFYEGETLKNRLDRGALPTQKAVEITKQIISGLSKAHAAGITHRDIKPANIILTNHGEVKIIDFGLAQRSDTSKITKDGATPGTVAYISPEQLMGNSVDSRTDIWSLGVVLYEMLNGYLPVKGEYEHAVVYSILNLDPEPMTDLQRDVPKELKQIVYKALTKKVNERYQHVDEMLNNLKNLKEDTQNTPRLHSSKIMESKPKKKLGWIVIPAGFIILLVILFFVFKHSFFGRTRISEPIPIAVISFENQTGDKTLDYLQKAIPDLLVTSLEQSNYFNVTTRQRMFDLLKQIGNDSVEIIDEDLGFELCSIEGVNTIVLGSFIKAGEQFATDVKVLDVESKRLLKSASSRGKGVGSILEIQIDELSRDIAQGVGLSERAIAVTQKPIAEVTTNSMEAYQ